MFPVFFSFLLSPCSSLVFDKYKSKKKTLFYFLVSEVQGSHVAESVSFNNVRIRIYQQESQEDV